LLPVVAASIVLITLFLAAWTSSWEVGLMAALPASFFVYLGFWSFRDVFRAQADVRLARRAAREVAPEDGRRAAVIGILEPLDAPLRAPLTGRECVAYGYQLHYPNRNFPKYRYWGLRIAPSVVRTSTERVKLLGYLEPPLLEDLRGDASLRNAEAYIASTPFTPSEWHGWSAPERFREAVAGSFREDYRSSIQLEPGHPAHELRRLHRREQILEPGIAVCAFGLYSAAEGALLPDPDTFKGGIDLLIAEPHEVLRRLDSKTTSTALLGVFWCVVALIVVAVAAS
jgi:hypothetical protein